MPYQTACSVLSNASETRICDLFTKLQNNGYNVERIVDKFQLHVNLNDFDFILIVDTLYGFQLFLHRHVDNHIHICTTPDYCLKNVYYTIENYDKLIQHLTLLSNAINTPLTWTCVKNICTFFTL